MDSWVWIIIAAVVVALVVLALAGVGFTQKRQTKRLRESFGPEYDRAMAEKGSKRSAESELEAREKRVEQLNIRPLSPEDRTRFTEAWRSTQARFVDDPTEAIGEANRLVKDVMQTRGYPVGDFEQRTSDISVDYAEVVGNYRAAHMISLANERGEASTEDLRQAMVHYRALFEELLELPETERTEIRQ